MRKWKLYVRVVTCQRLLSSHWGPLPGGHHSPGHTLCLQCYVNLLFWYQFFCGFSGSTMIDYWQMIFFNLFFTSLPPLIFGVLDKDISAETLLALPELYKNGQNSEVRWRCLSSSLPLIPPCRSQRKSNDLGPGALQSDHHSTSYLLCDPVAPLPIPGMFLVCC